MNIAGHEAVVIERDDGVIEIEITRTVFDVVYISYTEPEWADVTTRRIEAIECLTTTGDYATETITGRSFPCVW